MRRRIGFAVGISLFAATAAQAEPLRPGMAMPEIRLMAQHDAAVTIGAEVRYVLVTRDMDSGDLVKEALAENGGATLEAARAVYVSDISRMPGVITKLFALPAMRKRGYRILLDRDGKVVSVVRTSAPEDLNALKAKVESMLTSRKTPPQAAGMGSAQGTPFDPNGDSR